MIDVSKYEPAEVLVALYNYSLCHGMGVLAFRAGKMGLPEARELLAEQSPRYFDYLHGRVMKTTIGEKQLDERLYDRDNGDGAAWRALQTIDLTKQRTVKAVDF